jgi:hypothetical protein
MDTWYCAPELLPNKAVMSVWESYFTMYCTDISSEDHPTSYPLGTGGPFPGSKALPECDTDHSPPSSAEVKNE